MANSSRYANVPDLVVALVDVTALARPVLQTRAHPPTHTKCWMGVIRQLGGVINYALLDGTAYSLPPTFYFSW
jgi:hypothetical protein